MIAIDTNILVRIFVDDDQSKQKQLVAKFLSQQDVVYVSQVVQVEFVWVLESNYDYSKAQIIPVLEQLNVLNIFMLEQPKQFADALELFKSSKADFSDYIIFANSKHNKHDFWTFDKKLSKSIGVNLLK